MEIELSKHNARRKAIRQRVAAERRKSAAKMLNEESKWGCDKGKHKGNRSKKHVNRLNALSRRAAGR